MSLTEREEMELLQLLEIEEKFQAANDYYEYVKYTHGQMYRYTRHGEYICNTLDDAVKKRKRMLAGEIPVETQYIMVNVPPQHGKSMHITETFPSFFMGNFPTEGCIEVSYNDTFASKFGSKNKDKITEHGEELFSIRVSKDTNAKGEWEIIDAKTGKKTRGGMISRGIMSGITGSSLGDCIIIDDPIKNREEANSEVIREKHWSEWVDSIVSRIHPGAIVIIIMTRWHEDDLCGRLLSPEKGPVLPWKRINLPLECDEKHIADEGNPLKRSLGEPLWPERYGMAFVAERKAFPSSFNSLYQGRPTAQEGNMLKRYWWKYYDVLPNRMDIKILSVDASFKDTSDSAKCSIQVWGRHDGYIYIIDNITARMDFVTTVQAIINILRKHPDIGAKYIEDKANGSAIINVLNLKIGGFIPVKADSGTGGKEARVSAITPWIESGNVWVPRHAEWTNDFVEECASFPNGTYKDQVDAMSQGLAKLVPAIGMDFDPWNATPDAKRETPKLDGYDDFAESDYGSVWG
jgi:predicted phage terminase large subunit-like protein